MIFPSGPFETNAYLYPLPDKTCYLIDAPPESYEAVMQAIDAGGLTPTHLLLTHSHWDHIADVARFKKRFPDLQVAIHPLDAPNLRTPGEDGLPCWIDFEGINPNIMLHEGMTIGPLTVIETPGHTPGGVCFYDPENQVLFSGDTLFKGTIGNLSFPTARVNLMWQSLKKLDKLPKKTTVYPGHGEATTLENESWLPRAEEIFG
jgi:glyoxylase-like metal-dependent hydrolase (beta-lactamase superfamily II)